MAAQILLGPWIVLAVAYVCHELVLHRGLVAIARSAQSAGVIILGEGLLGLLGLVIATAPYQVPSGWPLPLSVFGYVLAISALTKAIYFLPVVPAKAGPLFSLLKLGGVAAICIVTAYTQPVSLPVQYGLWAIAGLPLVISLAMLAILLAFVLVLMAIWIVLLPVRLVVWAVRSAAGAASHIGEVTKSAYGGSHRSTPSLPWWLGLILIAISVHDASALFHSGDMVGGLVDSMGTVLGVGMTASDLMNSKETETQRAVGVLSPLHQERDWTRF